MKIPSDLLFWVSFWCCRLSVNSLWSCIPCPTVANACMCHAVLEGSRCRDISSIALCNNTPLYIPTMRSKRRTRSEYFPFENLLCWLEHPHSLSHSIKLGSRWTKINTSMDVIHDYKVFFRYYTYIGTYSYLVLSDFEEERKKKTSFFLLLYDMDAGHVERY